MISTTIVDERMDYRQTASSIGPNRTPSSHTGVAMQYLLVHFDIRNDAFAVLDEFPGYADSAGLIRMWHPYNIHRHIRINENH